MHIITIKDMKNIVQKLWVSEIIKRIEHRLQKDYLNWNDFSHSVRHAHYIKQGAIELMPVWNAEYFSYKYVNGHPENTKIGHPSVMWIGQLSECESWEPIMISEMTILTALRTAATTAFASTFFPCVEATHLAIIWNGSQSIFQTIALCEKYNIQTISHYDIDKNSMVLYKEQVHKLYPKINIISSKSSQDCISQAEIIITVTEAFGKQEVIKKDDLLIWACIFAIGWDCPNKTELDVEILKASTIVVEYEEQTRKEGEMQNYPEWNIYANLYELISEKKSLKNTSSDYYLFDGVWIWIEDYSALQVMNDILESEDVWSCIDLIPKDMNNLKNLYWYIYE